MDVRQSDIDTLEGKVKKKSYSKYLVGFCIHNVRSFVNQYIEFKFPVTAIIGTNGGGKSTILGAAALAYKQVKPGDFFPKSNVGDASMSNWSVEYDLIDRTLSERTSEKNAVVQRKARFAKAKWRRDNAPDRDVIVIPIQRTVPANELTKYKKFIGTSRLKGVQKSQLGSDVARICSRILGKDASGYQRVFLTNDA